MRKIIFVLLKILFLMFTSNVLYAQNCYKTSILAPTPFMGNHDEVFKTSDDRLWQVTNEYSYLYDYYPTVDICNENKLIIKGKTLNIIPIGANKNRKQGQGSGTSAQIKIIYKKSGCRSYFLADGDVGGIYLLEWYGGYDPNEGESIIGELRSYGMKDIFYPDSNSSGRVYVDDYMLSRTSAIEKISKKCR